MKTDTMCSDKGCDRFLISDTEELDHVQFKYGKPYCLDCSESMFLQLNVAMQF